MAMEVKEVVVCIRKVLLFTFKYTRRIAHTHPFLASLTFFLFLLYNCFPALFAFLVSSSPVFFCTALLLGTILSYGEPNLPEIEKDDNINDEVSSLKVQRSVEDLCANEDVSSSIERHVESEPAPGDGNEGDSTYFAPSPLVEEHNKIRAEQVLNDGFIETREVSLKEQIESPVRLNQVADNVPESIEDLKVKINRPELDDWLDSSLGSPWQPIDIHDTAASDSESDHAESSSSDASITDIIPMLDELHPLLDSEVPHHALKFLDNSDVEFSQHHESDDDSVEQEDECKLQEEKDNSNQVVTWTEDDQKNVMDLGSSEMERNRRLESLIARRRARKNQIIIFEKDLIDLNINDSRMDDLSFFHPKIPTISAPRRNPFDLPYGLGESVGLLAIPGSAPSVLVHRQNPFDFPCSQKDARKGLAGESLGEQEFSLNEVHRSSILKHNINAEKSNSEGNVPVDRQSQSSGKNDTNYKYFSDSKISLSANDSELQKDITKQKKQELGMGLSHSIHDIQSSGKTNINFSSVPDSMTFLSANKAEYQIYIAKQETRSAEQDCHSSENDLINFAPEYCQVDHFADKSSTVFEETHPSCDAYGVIKEGLGNVEFDLPISEDSKLEMVEQKVEDLTFSSLSDETLNSTDMSPREVVKTLGNISGSHSKESNQLPCYSIKSDDANFDRSSKETECVDNDRASIPVFDSSPSGSGNFLGDISAPDDTLLSAGRIDPHSTYSVESDVHKDVLELASHSRVIEKSISSEETEFELQLPIFTDKNVLDENESTSKEDFGDLIMQSVLDHFSSSMSVKSGSDEPTFVFSDNFTPSIVKQMHPSMGKFAVDSYFENGLGESQISNMELGPILEEISEDSKGEEEHVSMTKPTIEEPSVGPPSDEQKLFALQKESGEEDGDDAGEIDLAFDPEKHKPSETSAIQVNDVEITEQCTVEVSEVMEMKPELVFTSSHSVSQASTMNEFLNKQDVVLWKRVNDSPEEREVVQAEIEDIRVIDEHLLSELDAVGDYEVGKMISEECLSVEPQSICLLDRLDGDSEFSSSDIGEKSLNKLISANLNDPRERDLVLDLKQATYSGSGSLPIPLAEDTEMTVYNSKLNVLEACLFEELDSVFKQESEEDLTVPCSEVGLSNLDNFNIKIDAVPHNSELLIHKEEKNEDISSVLKEDGTEFYDNINEIQYDVIKLDDVLGMVKNEASSSGQYTFTRDLAIPETDSEVLFIEAKSLEDIDLAFKEAAEVSVNKTISPLVKSEPTLTDPVHDDVEGTSSEVHKYSDLIVLEDKSVEDLNSTFKQVIDGRLLTPIVVLDSEAMKASADLKEEVARSAELEQTSQLLVPEVSSVEEIQTAFKQAIEEGFLMTTSPDFNSELMRTHHVLEVEEAKLSKVEGNPEWMIPAVQSIEDADSTFKQANKDLDELRSQFDSNKTIEMVDDPVLEAADVETRIFYRENDTEQLLEEETNSVLNLSDEGVMDKSPYPLVDPEFENNSSMIGEEKSIRNSSSALKLDTEGVLVKPKLLLDPENCSDIPVLEAKSVEELNLTFKNATQACLTDLSSDGYADPVESHQYYHALVERTLDSENDSELILLEAKSVGDLKSAFENVVAGVLERSSSLLLDQEGTEIRQGHEAEEAEAAMSLESENNSGLLGIEELSIKDENSSTDWSEFDPLVLKVESNEHIYSALKKNNKEGIIPPQLQAVLEKEFMKDNSESLFLEENSMKDIDTKVIEIPSENELEESDIKQAVDEGNEQSSSFQSEENKFMIESSLEEEDNSLSLVLEGIDTKQIKSPSENEQESDIKLFVDEGNKQSSSSCHAEEGVFMKESSLQEKDDSLSLDLEENSMKDIVSKQTETQSENELKESDIKQVVDEGNKETTVVFDEVDLQTMSRKDQTDERLDGGELASEVPSSSSPASLKIKKNKSNKSDSSSSSSSSSSDNDSN